MNTWRGLQIPWIWSYKQLWAATWVLESNPDPVKGQWMLLSAEPSLQSHWHFTKTLSCTLKGGGHTQQLKNRQIAGWMDFKIIFLCTPQAIFINALKEDNQIFNNVFLIGDKFSFIVENWSGPKYVSVCPRATNHFGCGSDLHKATLSLWKKTVAAVSSGWRPVTMPVFEIGHKCLLQDGLIRRLSASLCCLPLASMG